MNPKNTKHGYKFRSSGEDTKKLFKILQKEPMSRRMAATLLGYTDQTYMVTEAISRWIKEGRAQVIGMKRCKRSNKVVGWVSTDPDLFENTKLTS